MLDQFLIPTFLKMRLEGIRLDNNKFREAMERTQQKLTKQLNELGLNLYYVLLSN